MAGLGSGIGTGLTGDSSAPLAALSSRRLFSTIAWLRWRIFVNSLRGKGAMGELVAKIISYPILALMILGPSFGAGFAAWYFVSHGMDAYLAIPLWIIFALWQFIGVSTSATGPTFDLSTLARFPIRYRDYLLMRLSFGLLDPPTLAGICCLIATSIGIAIAAPALFPWAATALIIYALCNVFFSRMVYSWLERWLAQRRTRELLTGVILILSLGFQFASQFIQRFTRGGRHAQHSPWMVHTEHVMLAVNWLLPPGLTASSIERMHSGFSLIASAALGGLLLYTVAFLLILHLRLHAEYLGENLSEAPAAVSRAKRISSKPAVQATALASSSHASFSFLPATVAACLIKEIRYLLRSGPKLYVLIMPVFIVFLFSMRTSGLNYAGMTRNGMTGMLFAYGCAYMQLIFVSLIYNSLGSDGAGVQFYFMAPLRIRDVMLAKNLLTFGIFAIEVILVYITSAFLAKPTPLDLTAATLAWCLFTLFVNMSIGNVRSIVAPKGIDPAKVRSQNVSGLNSFISLVTVAVMVGLGSLMVIVCRYLHAGYWPAAAVFLVLAILAFVAYVLVMGKVDGIAWSNVENLTGELSKR
jgi:ABC-2 type transport system permease protein